MPKDRAFSVQRTLYMTPEMWDHLHQIALSRGRDCTENNLMREAIRAFLDEQTEVIGSRRHFQKSFQQRLDQLDAQVQRVAVQQTQILTFYLTVVIHLLAFSLAPLLHHLTKTPITPQQLIQKAVIEARKEETVLAEQIRVVRDMKVRDRS